MRLSDSRVARRLRAVSFGLVAWGLLVPGLSLAQDAWGVPEVIVTAERREASLQTVPVAVSALSAEQLEKLQVTEAADLQRAVPSLHMFNNITSPTNLSLSLRGGLQQDASLVVAESPVGIYVDDIFVGRLNGNNSTLSDVERVEVLRGPQGTLYGRNTGYGAVRFLSRVPDDEFWFDATMGGGNQDQLLLKGSVGGPLGDAWAGSLAAQWKNKGDEYFNVAEGVETGDEENFSVRGKLRFRGLDNFDAILSAAISKSDNDSLQLLNGITPGVPDTCADFPDGDCDPGEVAQFTTDDLVFPNGEYVTNTPWGQILPAPLRDRPQGETDQTILGLTLSFDITDKLTVKSITGYVGTEDFFHTDFSGNSAAGGFIGASLVDSDQFTQELQLLGTTLGDRLTYIVGAFYLNESAQQQFGWNFITNLSQSFIDTDVDSTAVFGQAEYDITDRLTVTAGLRWTDDSKDFRFDFERFDDNFFNTVIVPGAFPAVQEQILLNGDSDEWTPKFGIDYSLVPAGPIDSMLLYAQAARGFKGGGFSAIALVSTFPVSVYDPETNWTYEGGLKADWFGSRLRTNLAYFFSDIQDIQQNATVAGSAAPEFPVQNSGDAEIQGVELEITAVPVDGLNLFLTGSFLDGKFTRLNVDSAANAARANLGVEPGTPQTPDYTFDVGFDYSIDVWGDVIGNVSFGADYYKIDDYITSATNDFNNSGWDIWNAFIAVEVGSNLELKLTGKNLSDDFIVTSGSRGLGGFITLPPREILFTATYRYGK